MVKKKQTNNGLTKKVFDINCDSSWTIKLKEQCVIEEQRHSYRGLCFGNLYLPVIFYKAVPCGEESQGHKRDRRGRQVNGFKLPHMIVGPRGKINATTFPLKAVRAEVQGLKCD